MLHALLELCPSRCPEQTVYVLANPSLKLHVLPSAFYYVLIPALAVIATARLLRGDLPAPATQ